MVTGTGGGAHTLKHKQKQKEGRNGFAFFLVFKLPSPPPRYFLQGHASQASSKRGPTEARVFKWSKLWEPSHSNLHSCAQLFSFKRVLMQITEPFHTALEKLLMFSFVPLANQLQKPASHCLETGSCEFQAIPL